MTTTKRLVVLGCGTAGTMVVNRLHRELDPAEWSVTVVDPASHHDYQPGYLFLPFGLTRPDQVRRRASELVRQGVEVVRLAVERVDPTARAVHLEGGRVLTYDELVVATGTSPHPEQVPGTLGPQWHREIGEFYTFQGALDLREQLERFTGGRLVVHVTEMPIKCPVAPLEFTFLADDWLRRRGLREATELVFVTPLDGAFTKPVASRTLGHLLESKGILVEPDFLVERIDQDRRVLVSYDEREVAYDQLVTVPLNMGADFVARSGLGDELNYVPVDPHTMQSRAHPDVWALGDAADLPTSKAGSVAHFSVDVFVENFLDRVAGRPMGRRFDGHANCFVESGHGKALLLDFNYDTEPLAGRFPLPVVGPLTLLGESRLNHLGKLAFRHLYWNALLPGRPLGLPAEMSLAGKHPA
ncbi:NAD(P)/FAD-dependent oxidoreductase [Oryzobacter sp. R7]|uniref:type III sulfide quinone reductase, selenoprotein subtype n=1 Tax=Oryzobacter faecalis TaxID=3388656 RepID=UPI00398D3DA9